MPQGIPQSTISDWRKKNTNPVSDKILVICNALDITPHDEQLDTKARARLLGYIEALKE